MVPPTDGEPNPCFFKTPWRLLSGLRVRSKRTHAERNFAQQLSIYQRPICSFIAAHGYEASRATEMAKIFIISLVARRYPGGPQPFQNLRLYVLAELRSFLAEEWVAETARVRNYEEP